MKIIFMGSAAFAVPSLLKLVEAKHDIQVVITQPDKPAGRGQKLTPCPAAKAAADAGLPLYQPKSVKSPKVLDKIKTYQPDIIVVVAYGKILPNELIETPKLGCVNLHSSLLPKYRGAAPINWAVVNGEKETGVTTMFINEELDAGDILLQSKLNIKDDDTAATVHDRLAEIGADLLIETVEGLKAKTVKPQSQDHANATFAPLIKKEDGLIDWSKDAKTINNLIRGMQPWPSAYTHLDGKMVRMFKVKVLDESVNETPGTIIIENKNIKVSTGNGSLKIDELQIEGKRRMTAADFLNGHTIEEKTVLR